MRTILAAVVSAFLFLTASQVGAQAPEGREINLKIDSETLAGALDQWAAQTGVQLISPSWEIAKKITATPLKGSYTAREALEKLLNGTPLRGEWLSHKAVTIRERSAIPAAGLQPRGADAKEADVPITRFSGETQRERLAANDRSAVSGAGDQSFLDRADRTGIPEIMVVGSRLSNTDIKRTEDDVRPYVVFEREQIDRSMAGDLQDFLRTQLPMNSVQTTSSQSDSSLGSNSSINLRGLGANQTLILVNGRRLAGVNNGGFDGFLQPDINGIPLSAIERIEVLPSTASGIYGGGATGGVINIITRQYSGMELKASYGSSFEGDAAAYRVDAGGGISFNNERTQLQFAASHAENDPVYVGDRDFVRRARALQYRNNPTAFFNNPILPFPPSGRTTNIASTNGSNLVLDNGTALNSPRTFVPASYSGPASDGGAALVANAGQYNLELPSDATGDRQSLLNTPTIDSASFNARQAFAERLEGFLDFAWYRNRGEFFRSSFPGFTQLAADAPNNPFTTAIRVRFPSTGFATSLDSEYSTVTAAGGVIVQLPADWTAGLDYSWSRSRRTFESTGAVAGDPDGSGPAPSLSQAITSGMLNVMRDLNAFPIDYSPYLLPSPSNFFGPATTKLQDTSLRLSGPALLLPAGPLTLSALAQYREEDADDVFQQLLFNSTSSAIMFNPARSQSVTSFYIEGRAPLAAKGRGLALLRDFELQASVRHDAYSTQGVDPPFAQIDSRSGPFPDLIESKNDVDATKFTFGFRYAPLQSLTLRASYGTGFLPPSINQVAPGAPFTGPAFLVDPKRGGIEQEYPSVTHFSGGNPDLDPEESESWSAGLILTPAFAPGWRLSLDYTRIRKTDEIVELDSDSLLALEDLFPGRVVRDPLTPGDAALGYTGGVITALDQSLINVAETRLEAWDLQLDYLWKTEHFGEFHFYTVATWQPEFERQTVPTSSPRDEAGYNFGPLEWRGNAGIRWQRDFWSLGWDMQYHDSYFIYSAVMPEFVRQIQVMNQGSATVPSQTYHDLVARFRFAGSASELLEGVELTLGIQNIFDKKPPVIATTEVIGGYSQYGDPRLRRFLLTMRKQF